MKTIDLMGEIGWSVTIEDVKNIVNTNQNEDLHFRIASLGGDVNHGLTIHDLISLHKGNTKATILGMTASAATIIALSCDEVEMSENALFLVHNAWTFAIGNADELEKIQDDLEKIDDIMVGIYQRKTGKSEKEIRDLMAEEKWLSAEEAKEFGFVDTIITEELKIAANFRLLPKDELINKLHAKMKLFKNDKKKPHLVAFKDGTQVLSSEEKLAKGVEVIPLGETELENGDYETENEVVTIEDNQVTDVKEVEVEEVNEPADVETIVDAVVTALEPVVKGIKDSLKSELEASFDAKIQALRKSPSQGTIVKKPTINNSVKTDVSEEDTLDKVRAKAKENYKNLKKGA